METDAKRGIGPTGLAWSPVRVVQAACAALAIIWTLLPALLHSAPPLDVVEGYLWGREWVLATYKHPALPSWIIEASLVLTGGAIGWPVYLAAQLFAAATLGLVYRLGRDVMDARRGAACALALVGIEYVSWMTPAFNHTIAQLPFWIGVIWLAWTAVERGGLGWWLALGVVAALGLYAKFSHAIILAVVGGWMLWDGVARRRLASPGPWIGLAVFIVITTPLVLWLAANGWQPFSYAAARAGEPGASIATFLLRAALVGSSVAVLLAVAVLPGIVAARAMPRPASGESDRGRRFLYVVTLVPVLVAMLAGLLNGHGLRTSWAAPMLVAATPLAVMALAHWMDAAAFRRLAVAAFAAIAIAPLAYGFQATRQPRDDRPPTRVNWPERELAAFAAARWAMAAPGKPLRIVAGDAWTAGLVGLRHRDQPSILTEGRLDWSPWIGAERLAKEGALVVWDARRGAPSEELKRLIGDRPVHEQRFNAARGGSVAIGYAVVAPR